MAISIIILKFQPSRDRANCLDVGATCAKKSKTKIDLEHIQETYLREQKRIAKEEALLEIMGQR